MGKKLEDIKTIGILRNALCHKESLVIFLEKGFRMTRQQGNKRDVLRERINSLNNIYKYHMEIEHNKKESLPNECWIMKYSKYRLRNGSGVDFKELKIDL